MHRVLLGVLSALASTAMHHSRAHACSPLGNREFSVDPVEVGQDTVPPGKPTVEGAITGREPPDGSSCDGLAYFWFRVHAVDDRTNPARLGYIVDFVSLEGLGPACNGGCEPVVAHEGEIFMAFYEKADKSPVEAVVRVAAIDLAGNTGEWSDSITLRHAGYERVGAGFESIEEAKARCHSGDPEGCLWAGKRLTHGFGVEQDLASGAFFYLLACARRHALACELVGDRRHAAEYYEFRCLAGQAEACRRRAYLYNRNLAWRQPRERALGDAATRRALLYDGWGCIADPHHYRCSVVVGHMSNGEELAQLREGEGPWAYLVAWLGRVGAYVGVPLASLALLIGAGAAWRRGRRRNRPGFSGSRNRG